MRSRRGERIAERLLERTGWRWNILPIVEVIPTLVVLNAPVAIDSATTTEESPERRLGAVL